MHTHQEMIASARIAYLARRAKDYGVATGAVNVDMVAVRQRNATWWKAGGPVASAG